MSAKQHLICLILTACSAWTITASAAISTRIVGGKPSLANQWPWMVALVKNGNNNYQGQFCGGSLISPTWVVTAAHCLRDAQEKAVKPGNIRVVSHLLDLKSDIGKNFAVKRIFSHPKFNTETVNNDIALLQLQSPVTDVPALPLVSGSALWVNATAAIIGWGALSDQDSRHSVYPNQLYDTTLPIISNKQCQAAYDTQPLDLFGKQTITDTMMCAGFSDGSRDTCNGDSGGPLVVKQNGQWRLAGITSWGNGCAIPGLYGVYTRVSKYLTFINNIMKINYVALADVNKDKVVNVLDKAKKNSDLKAKFQAWVKQCWTPQASCADVNADGVINQTDYTKQSQRVTSDYNTWLSLYWLPEAQ